MSLKGMGRWPDHTSATVLITDMSYDGCHIWTDHELSHGETVVFTIPTKGNIEGQMRWVRGGRAGVKFLDSGRVVDERRARLGI